MTKPVADDRDRSTHPVYGMALAPLRREIRPAASSPESPVRLRHAFLGLRNLLPRYVPAHDAQHLRHWPKTLSLASLTIRDRSLMIALACDLLLFILIVLPLGSMSPLSALSSQQDATIVSIPRSFPADGLETAREGGQCPAASTQKPDPGRRSTQTGHHQWSPSAAFSGIATAPARPFPIRSNARRSLGRVRYAGGSGHSTNFPFAGCSATERAGLPEFPTSFYPSCDGNS